MRLFTLTFLLVLAYSHLLRSQCDVLATLQVVDNAGIIEAANQECTDNNGWTHYYNDASGHIILSIKKNGQDVGSLQQGLTVTTGTLPTYSQGAYNLSNADYIDNDVWTVINRTWQVTGANGLNSDIRIRFYFSGTDVNDIAETVDDFGFFVDEPDDIYMYAVGSGNGLDPLATVTQPAGAFFTLYDMFPGGAPDWESGDFNGFPFGEFTASTLDIAGGAGFLIFQNNDLLSISGNIARADGVPVPDANVQAASISTDVTDGAGDFTCPSLISGGNYEVVPTKDINHAEGISMADLIAMSRHISGLEPFTSPYQHIAADADKNAMLTFLDIAAVRDVLLGNEPNFPNNHSWRFVPETYVFPDPNAPFVPPFPESISVPILTTQLGGQDFIGVKIGDVADASTAAPPALNTSFSLPALYTCNPGDTVVFPLTVQDFENIRAFQFTLSWDPAVMSFLEVGNFNLNSFTAAGVGTSATSGGQLTFAWYNPMNLGTTVADGTAICQIRFVASGNVGDSTPLAFTNVPTDLLLLHQNLSQVVPATVAGSFAIENNSTITGSADLTPTGCNGEATGAIDLDVAGGMPPFDYEWSNGATSQDLSNLATGEYWVTVSDAAGTCPRVFIFNIAPPSPMQLTADVFNMSCPYMVDGTVELSVAGGFPPLGFSWSNGSSGSILENLLEGTYAVTVTDAAGCTATEAFEVENPNKIYPMVSVTNASYMTSPNGAIMINSISGGTGPFSFLWNNGATSQSLMNILPGDYVVTITDGVGCHHVYGYVVYGLFTAVGETGQLLDGLGIFPNPAQPGSPARLELSLKQASWASIAVVSLDGKTLSVQEFQAPTGVSSHSLAAPDVPGMYFLRVALGGETAGWVKWLVR